MGEGVFLAEITPLARPLYQLFTLFMITDPRTVVSTRKGQMIVACLIALVEMFFRLGEAVYAPFYALFIVGPLALVIDILYRERNDAGVNMESGKISTAKA